MTEQTFPYGRFHARSEKHLTDHLNKVVGKGQWTKVRRMIGYAEGRTVEDAKTAPQFAQPADSKWGFSTQVYRCVVFKTLEGATKAKLFTPTVEEMDALDMVAARSFHEGTVTDNVRYWCFERKGLPWESKAEANRLFEEAKCRHDVETENDCHAEMARERDNPETIVRAEPDGSAGVVQ